MVAHWHQVFIVGTIEIWDWILSYVGDAISHTVKHMAASLALPNSCQQHTCPQRLLTTENASSYCQMFPEGKIIPFNWSLSWMLQTRGACSLWTRILLVTVGRWFFWWRYTQGGLTGSGSHLMVPWVQGELGGQRLTHQPGKEHSPAGHVAGQLQWGNGFGSDAFQQGIHHFPTSLRPHSSLLLTPTHSSFLWPLRPWKGSEFVILGTKHQQGLVTEITLTGQEVLESLFSAPS